MKLLISILILVILIIIIYKKYLFYINRINIYIRDYYNLPCKIVDYTNKFINNEDLSTFCIEKILNENEVEKIVNKIKENKKIWKKENPLMNVLGTASYIEGPKGGYDLYKKEYKKTNKILEKEFGELYKILLNYFQKRTPNAKVKYRYSLPGFHIFNCNILFNLPITSVHKDNQYQYLKIGDDEDIDYNKTLSFTLCLELPPTGGGLYQFEENLKIETKYKPGYIVCHNGHTTHMISPSPFSLKNINNYRITLQGHGIYDKKTNIWWLYW